MMIQRLDKCRFIAFIIHICLLINAAERARDASRNDIFQALLPLIEHLETYCKGVSDEVKAKLKSLLNNWSIKGVHILKMVPLHCL